MNFDFESTFNVDKIRCHASFVKIILRIAIARLGTMLRAKAVSAVAALKRLPVKRFLKSLLSRHLLYIVLLNLLPIAILLWMYFGNYVVLAGVMSLRDSRWWEDYQQFAIALGCLHLVYSFALLVQRRIPFGYIVSLAMVLAPFAYVYWMYVEQVKTYSTLCVDPRLYGTLAALHIL